MTVQDILTIIGLFLLYATGLVTVFVNLRIKIKEIEIKMMNLQDELAQHKVTIGCNVQRLEERNTIEHDTIMVKIDALLEKVTELRVTQAKDSKIINK
jgi:hypothetical protein